MLSIIVKCSYNTIHDVLGFSYPASMDMTDNWLFNTEMIGEAHFFFFIGAYVPLITIIINGSISTK